MPENVPSNRTSASVALNYQEAPDLLQHWGLKPNAFSPFREMCRSQSEGEKRSLDEILAEARERYEEEQIGSQIKALAKADRSVEARLALFGSASDAFRFYWSDAAETPDWSAVRSHDSFDCGLLFPYSTEEILRWVSLQTVSSGGVTVSLPSLDLSFLELNVLAGMLDAWKMDFARSVVERDATDLATVPLRAESVARALQDGLEIEDRRFLTTCIQKLVKHMVRPGKMPPLSLRAIGLPQIEKCFEGFERAGLISRDKESGHRMPTPAFMGLAYSLYSWSSVFFFHDVQVVEGNGTGYRAQEDVLFLWSTPVTLWALISDGLTGSKEDSENLSFQLTSCDQSNALEALEVFLQTIERGIDDAFYQD